MPYKDPENQREHGRKYYEANKEKKREYGRKPVAGCEKCSDFIYQ